MNHRQGSSALLSSALPMFVAGAALVLAAWMAFGRGTGQPVYTEADARPVASRGELAAFEQTAIDIFERSSPSVVQLESRARRRDGRLSESSGTGFVWDSRGYVVTNFHVVQTADAQILVRVGGGRQVEGVVVGFEPTLDIAVVKLEQDGDALKPLPIGSSKELRVGQAVFAIGNPFGLDQTLSTGVVSALDRVIESVAGTPIEGVIQVDAAINPGNSGGPLLDSAGRVIGMNTSILSPSGANAGIGFAVPIDTINRVAPRLIRGDRGTRPALGIQVAGRFRYGGSSHPMISQVVAGSGAADAGLRGEDRGRYGDLILAVDGVPVQSTEDLHAVLDQKQLDQTIRLRVLRQRDDGDFEELEVPVTLRTELQRR